MRRIFTLLLALFMVATMMTACYDPEDGTEQNPQNENKPADDIPSNENPGNANVQDPIRDYENVITTDDGSFVGKDNIYTYKGNHVALLKLENHGNKNYTVTVAARYLDAQGNEIKTETQTFEGFPAGWENYFFFNPGIQFSDFTYTLIKQEFSGECGVNGNSRAYLTRCFETKVHHIVNGHIDVQGGKVPTLSAEFQFDNFKASQQFLTELVIDKNGEICAIHRYETSGGGSGIKSWPIYQTTEEELVIPENLQGDLIGVVCFHSVVPLD